MVLALIISGLLSVIMFVILTFCIFAMAAQADMEMHSRLEKEKAQERAEALQSLVESIDPDIRIPYRTMDIVKLYRKTT